MSLPTANPARVPNTRHSNTASDFATLVVDADGYPKRVYRGEHAADTQRLTTRLPSLAFASAQAASIYALHPNRYRDVPQAPRTVLAYLQINRPVFNDPSDPFIDLYILAEALGHERAIAAALRVDGFIDSTNNWQETINPDGRYESVGQYLAVDPDHINNLYVDIYPVLDDPQTVAELMAAGYDGAIHAGMGETRDDTEYRVFSESQVYYALTGQCAA